MQEFLSGVIVGVIAGEILKTVWFKFKKKSVKSDDTSKGQVKDSQQDSDHGGS